MMLPLAIRKSLTLTSGPATRILSTDDAKAQLRVDTTDEDDLIAGLVLAAEGFIDGANGGYGWALITQTWDMRLDSFCMPGYHPGDIVARQYGHITIPLAPLQTIDAITYVDVNGDTRTLDSDVYQRIEGGQGFSQLVPAYGQKWPETRAQMDAVKIRFTAGYGDDADDVPADIVQAAKLMVAHWYANREPVVIGKTPFTMPLSAEALLSKRCKSWL